MFWPIKFTNTSTIGKKKSTDNLERPLIITKNILLGNRESLLLPDILHKKYGITHILNLCSTYKEPSKESGIIGFKSIPIDDMGETDLSTVLDIIFDFADKALNHGKLLVACRLGLNRSVIISMALYMRKNKKSFKDTFSYMKRLHPTMTPHQNYLQQLEKLEVLIIRKEKINLQNNETATKLSSSTPTKIAPLTRRTSSNSPDSDSTNEESVHGGACVPETSTL